MLKLIFVKDRIEERKRMGGGGATEKTFNTTGPVPYVFSYQNNSKSIKKTHHHSFSQKYCQ